MMLISFSFTDTDLAMAMKIKNCGLQWNLETVAIVHSLWFLNSCHRHGIIFSPEKMKLMKNNILASSMPIRRKILHHT